MRARCQPVILLGMHRSGTAMIARLLDELGLFSGRSLEENHESTFFLKINEALMQRVSAAWDHPAPMRDFLALHEPVELTAECLKRTLTSIHAVEYLGLSRLLRYWSVFGLTQPWGWKDPRTIFTLPLWLMLFPGAKLIYMMRNGVDVAASLVAREQERLQRRRKRVLRRRFSFTTRGALERLGYQGSARCLTMPGAFSLWEEYVSEAQRQLESVSNDRLIVSYEQFLADPPAQLATMAAFCGLACGGAAIERAARQVHAGRAHAFVNRPEHVAFYRQVRTNPCMVRSGYGALQSAR